MIFIPGVKMPYEDELLYSWIHRLAQENGLSEVSFMNAYCGGGYKGISELPYDIKQEFPSLWDSIYYRDADAIHFYLKHSLFPFEAVFMTEMQQARYIDNVFRPKSIINQPVNSMIQEIHICPECMREDIEQHSEAYLHRAHHISGCTCCYKHGIPLMRYVGESTFACDYNIDDFEEISQRAGVSLAQKYAVYSKGILDAKPGINIYHIKSVIQPILLDAGFKEEFMASGYCDLFESDLDNLKKKLYTPANINPSEIIPALMCIYPAVEDLLSALKKDEHEILGGFKCPTCGHEYVSSVWSHENGWGCPICEKNKSTQDLMEELVSRMSDNEYEVRSEFVSMTKPIEVFHKSCGAISKIKPRSFLFENVRCKCESTITFSEAKEKVEANTGFKLIRFTNTNELIEVFHEECGQTFECRYHKFINFPHCHYCNPRYTDTEVFERYIAKLTGDEYTLLSPFVNQDTKVEIRHNPCGHTKWYKPNHFLEGQRCPVCAKLTDEWYKMYWLLSEFKEENGNTNVGKRDVYKDMNLGTWCQHQRQAYGKGKLTEKQTELLLALGFDFNPLETEWNRRFQQYKRYIALYGNGRITRRTDFEGEHLGAWVFTQTNKYKQGTLPPERRALLSEIDDYFTENL